MLPRLELVCLAAGLLALFGLLAVAGYCLAADACTRMAIVGLVAGLAGLIGLIATTGYCIAVRGCPLGGRAREILANLQSREIRGSAAR